MSATESVNNQATATLAGGCFWCLEAVYEQLQGVTHVASGYTGGTVANPSYRQVCTGTTGHAEAVRITYDPQVIAYRELLEVFFEIHDPTTLNRQGNDVGTQYRSAIFVTDDEQKAAAQAARERAAAIWDGPIVTEIVPESSFYEAEDYHQKYYLRGNRQILKQFQQHYPQAPDLMNSTAAARVNGYLGGYGTSASLKADIDRLGLSDAAREELLERVGNNG